MEPPAPEPTPPLARVWRRKVVQWSIAYAAAAWALVQVVEFAVATFQWPESLIRGVAVAAVAGLPIIATLAWYHGDRGRQDFTRVEIAVVALLAAVGALLVIRAMQTTAPVSGRTSHEHVESSSYDPHRVAILPFENLGGDAANAPFVGGVHDTLITIVGKIPGLAVIAKGSVLQFAGQHPTISAVARSLRAGSILEGSVAREGKRLRIQAQLVDANTDANLWAETYDRQADDLFDVQRDIAEAVAEQLRIRLSTNDTRQLARASTKVPAAYEHYTLGRNAANEQDWPKAASEYSQAVVLDPTFAAAQAQLGLAWTWVGFFDPTRRSETIAKSKAAIDKALELDPTLPEAHLALAIYYYRGVEDLDRAGTEFERAVASLPNDADAHRFFGFLRRYQGRWDEAEALFGRAAELDPHGEAVKTYALTLVTLGKREEAAKVIAAGAAARPDDVELAMWPGDLAANFSCDLRRQEAVLKDVAQRFPHSAVLDYNLWQFALTIGDLPAARIAFDRLDRQLSDSPDDDASFQRGVMALALGEHDRARAELEKSAEMHRRRAASSETNPDFQPPELALLALDLALMDDRSGAITQARRALAGVPKDHSNPNTVDANLNAAAALARAGDFRGATEALQLLFSRPSLYKPCLAWCDPMLAPLRSDARYRQFMASRGVDVTIDPLRRETWPRAGVTH